VNLPTDLLGVTYQRLESNKVEATAEAVALHFAKEFEKDASDDPFAALRVICHPDIASLQVSDKLPFDWLMRAMYLGTEGARAWLNIAADPTSSDIERDLISGTIKEMLNASPSSFRTYVSLGPGDANLDKAVAVQLLRKEPTAQCIPVDLSDGLLWVAIRSLSERIRVPIGLLADFEANFKFVTQRVREYSKGPYLYGMFGNTFGNLDRVERDFIGQMRDYLAPEDELIMDVSVVKSGKATNGNLWKSPGKKRFFAHGAARLLGTSAEDVLENFRDIIKVKRTVTNNPIAHTQLLTVSANRRPFARVRRYHLGSLIEYFRTEGFETRAKQIPTDGLFDIGVVAIRRKKT
jgi:hypothetical protein